jgi:hypothetical protein
VDATPHAASLIEGHRDFGYNLETALADIIDNAITAGARNLALVADTVTENPWIALSDDGSGMSEKELIEAMRLGSKNPTEKRLKEDLGRFGLGLKSASFSQCRSLTVLTRKDSNTSCARWNLDRVVKRNDWNLELIDNPDTVIGNDLLKERGTVVIWENLDRLYGGYTNEPHKRTEHMNSELTRAEYHLQLVFHRFLEGVKPSLNLSLNGRFLKPIDPLASFHNSTQKDPEEILRLNEGDVKIRCHTLPHHKRMSREEWEEIGGPEGHLKSQGLYIYREQRLIITGSWLGLARQTELTKLCRIAVDIPNTMDAKWKIDVKKASAQLPPIVRDRLKKVVERFVGTSKRTYRSRGQKLVDEGNFPIWNRVRKDGQTVFRPNIEHPVFLTYAEHLPEDLRDGFKRCLRLLGAGLPIETLHAELIGNAESVTSDETLATDLEELVFVLANNLLENGTSANALADNMRNFSYLRSKWNEVEPLLNKFLTEADL